MASQANDSLLGARMAMIEGQLKPCGVVSPRLASAFYHVPREQFVAAGRRGLAYTDAAQPVAPGRSMLPPLSLGRLLEKAAPEPDEHVLVIGAATGYAANLLALCTSSVVALECDADLAATARRNLAAVANVSVVEGPLSEGWADSAPYSLILINGAVEFLPEHLATQLPDGGRILAILQCEDGVKRAAIALKREQSIKFEPFAEAPGALLPSFGKPPAFRF